MAVVLGRPRSFGAAHVLQRAEDLRERLVGGESAYRRGEQDQWS